MKTLFSHLKSARTPEKRQRWRRDPLSHPDLASMSQTELADLPFDPCRIGK